jgi:hypothetical protein
VFGTETSSPEGAKQQFAYYSLGIPPTAAWHDDLDRPHHIYHGEPIRGLC